MSIELQNYRCFGVPSRASFTFDRGVTAFVGPNNAGKSTILKLFYELRPLFLHYSGNVIGAASSPGPNPAGYHIVYPPEIQNDPAAIFTRGKMDPLTVTIQLSGDATRGACERNGTVVRPISECRITIARETPTQPKFEILYGGNVLDCSRGVSGPPEFLQFQNVQSERFDSSDLKASLSDLANTMYVGPFRNLVNIGQQTNYYDLPIGEAFIAAWARARTMGRIQEGQVCEYVIAEIEQVFGLKRLAIEATPDHKHLRAYVDREPFDISELGSGLSQFVALLYVAKTRMPSYMLIDEPEANLHPSLQLDFLTRLEATTTQGILFATHSIGLARSSASRIYSIHKPTFDAPSVIRDFHALPNIATFMGELSYSGSCDLGFSKLLLVEGPSDAKVFEQFLGMLGVNHKVTYLHLGGGSSIGRHTGEALAQITQITRNVFAIIDSERTDAEHLPQPQREFTKACEEFKLRHLIMERRSIECYFTPRAIKAALGDKVTPLGKFERVPPGWPKQENWRVAAAMTWDELKDTDLGAFLELVAQGPDSLEQTALRQ